eukprot:1769816-Prymnesium_polylepis.1
MQTTRREKHLIQDPRPSRRHARTSVAFLQVDACVCNRANVARIEPEDHSFGLRHAELVDATALTVTDLLEIAVADVLRHLDGIGPVLHFVSPERE